MSNNNSSLEKTKIKLYDVNGEFYIEPVLAKSVNYIQNSNIIELSVFIEKGGHFSKFTSFNFYIIYFCVKGMQFFSLGNSFDYKENYFLINIKKTFTDFITFDFEINNGNISVNFLTNKDSPQSVKYSFINSPTFVREHVNDSEQLFKILDGVLDEVLSAYKLSLDYNVSL